MPRTKNKLYTGRAEKLEDGSLVDVSQQARANRFLAPVALTDEVHDEVCDLSGEYVLSTDTAESRLQRLLHYARREAGKHLDTSAFGFSVYMPVAEATTYHLRLVLHAGDDLEDVITISKDVPKEETAC